MPVAVRISEGQLEAVVEVKLADDENVDLAVIRAALDGAGVRHGIEDDAFTRLLDRVGDAEPDGEATIICERVACATPPIDGEDGSLQISADFERSHVGVADEFGAIDYRDRGAFTHVEENQRIVTVVPATLGSPGIDVRGHEIAPRPGREVCITAGAGTVLSEDGTELRAACQGDLIRTGDRFEVTQSICVSGNLDYDMGSIRCDGSVQISGDVLPGFHVHSGGNVSIGGTVDSAEILADGDVVVRQGVVQGSRIIVTGSAEVGHTHDSYIESGRAIKISRESLHATLVAGTNIVMPARSRVLGGKLSAAGHIEVGAVGSVNAIETSLVVGVDPHQEFRKAKLAARIDQADAVRERIERLKSLADPQQQISLDRVRERETASRERSASDLDRLDENGIDKTEIDPSVHFVKIHREAHPAVCVRIGETKTVLRTKLGRATFRLEPQSGKVTHER